ncbi:hypothetical protein LIER_39510 [Lithospermum erythrorhizon]|uniref:Uncharacterized protein n=1 Tax=Lithospermum erythrorhizon TaxID=34254 RepID=A0AAV3QG16_LITER
MKLFIKFSHVKRLTLSTSTVEILVKSCLPLPTFNNLICVNLGVVGTLFLVELQNKMPKLEVLVLPKGVDGELDSVLQENAAACVSLTVKVIRISDNNRRVTAVKAVKSVMYRSGPLGLEACEIVIVTDKIFGRKFCKL